MTPESELQVMKLELEKDEWYPVYSLADMPSTYEDENVEVSPEFVERYRAAFREFNKVQDILRGLDR